MSSASFLKRLEQLEKVIRVKQPRLIVITVPTDASTGLVSAEHGDVAELHRELAVTDTDLVVHIASYCSDNLEQPQLVSITQQY